MADNKPFWETKTLSQMTKAEWESLCDGCGRCCLVLLHDEDDGAYYETDIACKMFDAKKRRCKDYKNRSTHVADCVTLTPASAKELSWMPPTCAYRLLARGAPLPSWHPLITGSRDSVVEAGIAVSAKVINENRIDADDIEDYITQRRDTSLRASASNPRKKSS